MQHIDLSCGPYFIAQLFCEGHRVLITDCRENDTPPVSVYDKNTRKRYRPNINLEGVNLYTLTDEQLQAIADDAVAQYLKS